MSRLSSCDHVVFVFNDRIGALSCRRLRELSIEACDLLNILKSVGLNSNNETLTNDLIEVNENVLVD